MLDYFRMFEEGGNRFPGFENEIQGIYRKDESDGPCASTRMSSMNSYLNTKLSSKHTVVDAAAAGLLETKAARFETNCAVQRYSDLRKSPFMVSIFVTCRSYV